MRDYRYNHVGSSLDTGERTFAYNRYERISRTTNAAGTENTFYRYNGAGERALRTSAQGEITVFHFDAQRNMISETQSDTTTNREFVFLNGLPLAQIENGSTYYVHANQTGAPQKLTDQSQNIVWSADYEPFGIVSITNSAIEHPIRYPGQYYETETATHYNYFRTYDAETGRYLESDPIGLDGGLNTFLYASASPLLRVDPLGLTDSFTRTVNIAIARGRTQFLRDLKGVATQEQRTAIDVAIKRLTSSADDILAAECKGSTRRAFPNEFINTPLDDIIKLANSGNKNAKKAKKLLTDRRFKK